MIQFFDASTGVALPCSDCTVSTFVAGTSTPVKKYVDSTATTQNPFVITLNSLGMTTSGIWLGPTCYEFSLANPAGAVLWTQDQVCANNVTSFNTRTGAITLESADVASVPEMARHHGGRRGHRLASMRPGLISLGNANFRRCASDVVPLQ